MRYAIILGVILVTIPLMARLATPEPFPDAASYETLREAKLQGYDSLYATPFTHSMTDRVFSIMNPQIILILLAAAALIFASIYRSDEIFIILIAISPEFIRTFTTAGPGAIGITLLLATAVLIKYKQYWAVLFVPVIFLTGFSLGILATIVLIAVAILAELPFVALGISFFALISSVVVAFVTATPTIVNATFSIDRLIGFIGETSGITIFLVFLAGIGFLVQYISERKPAQFLVLLAVPICLFLEYGGIILTIILAFYGANAWKYLSERTWSFEELRAITLVLIACGLLFTCLLTERERITVDSERVNAVAFVEAGILRGAPIATDSATAPVLAYHGYPAQTLTPPEDAAFAASYVREAGFEYVLVRGSGGVYAHFPLVYTSKEANGYHLYAVPKET